MPHFESLSEKMCVLENLEFAVYSSGATILGGNCLGCNNPGGNCLGRNYPEGNFPWGKSAGHL